MGLYEVKSRKGLIRVKCTTVNNHISSLTITGDFFIYPEDSLWIIEDSLRNIDVAKDEIMNNLKKIINEYGIELIGSTIEDFTEAIYCACSGSCGD